jgi:casein kinase II subunit alpha
MGTDELHDYVKKYRLTMDFEQNGRLKTNHTKVAWRELITTENHHLISEEALDLVDRLLR